MKEKECYGYINDGSGKRYRAGVFYVLSGDFEKAIEFFDWFSSEFPDDIGEPVFDLYWAIAAYRVGRQEKARVRLQHAMLQNLYMLPRLFGEDWKDLDIWHSSNRQYRRYLDDIEEFLHEPTTAEREWIKQQFYSDSFRRLRDAYIDHYGRLLNEHDLRRRKVILQSWDRVAASILDNN